MLSPQEPIQTQEAGQRDQGRLRAKETQQAVEHPSGGTVTCSGLQGKDRSSLPCTLMHSAWLKALCLPMAFTNVWAFTQYTAPGSMVSRCTGTPLLLTILTCSFRRAENSYTLREARQERERRAREGKRQIFPFQAAYRIFLLIHSFIHICLLCTYYVPSTVVGNALMEFTWEKTDNM